MTIEEFKKSINGPTPPELSKYLISMWYDLKGDWNKAHEIAQEIHDNEGSRIHAYLHRKEGDFGNAGYWYARAGREMPDSSLDQEWTDMVRNFLGLENK